MVEGDAEVVCRGEYGACAGWLYVRGARHHKLLLYCLFALGSDYGTMHVPPAGTPWTSFAKIVLESAVEAPELERSVTWFVTSIDKVVTSTLHCELSTSIIIYTSSPGANPSLAKDIFEVAIPLLMMQQLVIIPLDSITCWWTGLVSRSVISLPPRMLNCLVTGSKAAVI